MRKPFMTPGDRKFILKLMRIFGVRKVYINWSKSQKKWPDIWVQMNKIPIITVTAEWARQDIHERRKRLTHEFLHIVGRQHDESIGYSTYPDRDTFSMKIYNAIIGRRK